MTKLCPRGKAAAKRKFKVYPSAYANAYASKICAGKIKDPSGVKRKDFKGPKPAKKGAMIKANEGKDIRQTPSQKISEALKRPVGPNEKIGDIAKELKQKNVKVEGTLRKGKVKPGTIAFGKFDAGKLGPGVDISNIVNKEKQKRIKLANKLKKAYDKIPTPSKSAVKKGLGVAGRAGLGALGATGLGAAAILGAGTVYEVGSMVKNLGKKVYTAHKAGQYRKEKKPTATFQKRSTKKQQIRDQKSERFLKYGNISKGYLSDSYEFSKGGFNKVGNHEVMGSPISVDVDDDNLTNASASDYYKDLLK
jgi:hypothetical protein|tara:strand:- start:89 stop:1009 length:921 start_codon:yes stop_codon:yes gene_type:complete